MRETIIVLGTAQESIEYLRTDDEGTKYLLIVDPSKSSNHILPLLSVEEESLLLDELGGLGEGRLAPILKYDREDIYFDRYSGESEIPDVERWI